MKAIISLFLLSSMGTQAYASVCDDAQRRQRVVTETEVVKPLCPTYLKDVTVSSGWASNWFIEANGGASAFIGQPVGCGDLFDRIEPALQIGIGKWFTPAVGGRIAYHGLEFKNANLQKMKYQYFHADFMYNITSGLSQDENGISRWGIVPFVGAGMIRNGSGVPMEGDPNVHAQGNHPFAFNYGVAVRYHVGGRVHLVGEVSGITTLQNFDCIGRSGHLGDNFLNVSAGLSVTIGKNGWKKVIDAAPYIEQNDYLLNRYYASRNKGEDCSAKKSKVKNNYSGLNSLRYRMSLSYKNEDSDTSHGDSIDNNSKSAIGVPVYFYFKINTAKLVNRTQLSNLKEIAEIAKEKNVIVKITGAADSATGSEQTNRRLSIERAKYIGKLLMKYGVEKSKLKASSLGGIDDFSPKEANRHTCVILLNP
jgi:outer membrane protein OmpA-like peptidoglycan-associated protein